MWGLPDVTGSPLLRPQRLHRIDPGRPVRRVNRNPIPSPITDPSKTSLPPWASTIRSTEFRSAPSAMRTPISFLRCDTMNDITP